MLTSAVLISIRHSLPVFVSGVLADLSPEEAVALLSALVFQEKSDVDPALPPALAAATEQLAAIAHEAGVVQAEAGLPLQPDEWARSVLKFGLVEVNRWCS